MGKNVKKVLKGTSYSAYGKNSVFERLLKRNNLQFNEIDISSGPEVLDEMINKSNGKKTIPQIFFDNLHIGGYAEIRELEKSEKLLETLK